MAEPPNPPFIPAKHHSGDTNLPVNRIVIHGTVSPCERGGARNIARYFQNPSYVSSCHYVVDPDEVYQCVNDWTVAYHAPPNEHSIGVELCDPQSGPDSRWDDALHQQMLDRAAALVRQLCLAYDVPMVWLMPDDLRAGKRGITDHENVGSTWRQTTHTDPGWSTARSESFMRRVLGAAESAPATPEPGGSDVSYDDARRAFVDVLWHERHKSRVPNSNATVSIADGALNADAYTWQLRGQVDQLQGTVQQLAQALAQQQGLDPAAVAEALRPVIADTAGPVITAAVRDALGADNDDTAQAIVDRIAEQLAGQNTG